MKLRKPGIGNGLRAWRSNAASDEPAAEKTESPVGVLLRASRLRCGEDLTAVAQALRIRRNYLEALEEGHFGDLPGATYAVGFVRSYAEHLGLDGDEVVRRFKAEASGIHHSTSLVFPSPTAEGSIPGGALMLVGTLLAVLAYGGWYLLSTQNQTVVELVPKIPERLTALVDNLRTSLGNEFGGTEAPAAERPTAAMAPVVTAAPEPSVSPTRSETTTVSAPQGAAIEAIAGQTAVGEARTATPPAASMAPPAVPGGGETTVARLPDSSEAPTAFGQSAEEGTARIVVRAKADSWVQVRDDTGNQVLFTRQMKAGDTYDVPNRAGLKLLTGNAGGLEIIVDGETTPSLGPVGMVRRDISLNAELLRAGAPVRP